MRSTRFKSRGGGGAVAPSDADIVWPDRIHLRDKLAVSPVLPESLHLLDKIVLAPKLNDALHLTDAKVATATATALKSDTLHLPDTFQGSAASVKANRTASPDADILGDGWVDSTPGVAPDPRTINHGNESPLPVSDENIIPAVTRRAYFRYDLTRFANLSAPTGGTMVFRMWADTFTVAVAQTVEARFSHSAATPFTESTLTWNNQPAVGSGPVTKSQAQLLRVDPLTAQYREYVWTLTAAEYGPYLGKWLLIMITSATLVAVGVLNVASREHVEGGPAGLRPLLSFDFAR